MEDTLVFVDDGFFGLVKKDLQEKTKKNFLNMLNHYLIMFSIQLVIKLVTLHITGNL